ncbi:MAG: hypothetical protein ACKO7B_03865 [Flavobacteriales bacterium]
MRIIATIPHPQIKISVFLYNEKYIIELEAGQYKQTFKISADSVEGLDGVKALLTEELIANCLSRFSGMHADFKRSFDQLK